MKTDSNKSCLLIALLFLLASTKLVAQSCMNISSQVANSENHQNISTLKTESNFCDAPNKIRVYFHLSKKGGTSNWTAGDVQDVLNILNKDYNTHNIFFVWDGIINFTDVKINDQFESDPFFVNHTDGVDIYISTDGFEPNGMATSIAGSSNMTSTTAIFLDGKLVNQQGPYSIGHPAAKTSLISHEMGHLLGLFHVEYKDASGCQEYADGTNSNTCGDYISDTPPVNYGYSYNGDICQYVENKSNLSMLYDPLGVKYSSASAINDNIMRGTATTSLNCYGKFTSGQGEKMCNMINTNDHLKKTLISDLTAVQNKQERIHFDVYPNPTSGIITISKKNIAIPNNQIFIKNVLGEVVKVVAFDAALESINIDLSSSMEGCYFITDDRNSAITRVVVK